MKITPNNLDLIRLLAASQVMVNHVVEHTHADIPQWLHALLDVVPGVPIFFAISGFLIYQSYAKSQDVREYAVNRVLRLYPGLIACFIFSLACVFGLGYLRHVPSGFGVWTAGQLTAAQFYNPDFLRGFGVGVLNGSLWTISVELQFYVLTPFIHRHAKRLPLLVGVFVLLNLAYLAMPQGNASKLAGVTFLPWFYMFLTGAYLSRRREWLELIAGKLWLIPAYLLTAFVALKWVAFGNLISPPFFVLLIAAVFSVAYFKADTADKILRRNDISYGIYIYHMPVINALIYAGVSNAGTAIALTFTLAILSWVFVEKPALRLKHISLRPV